MNTGVSIEREIGPVGTAARLGVGVASLAIAVGFGVNVGDALVGLVAAPLVVTLVTLARGRHAPPLRAHGAAWHIVNIGLAAAFFSMTFVAALVFYGTSMIVAAWRGFGACELLAISNLLRRRNDQLACPFFLPIDVFEARVLGRELYCS